MLLNEGNFQTLMTRVLMMAAIAVIGNLYRRMEQKRQRAVSVQQESAEDIFFGQIAIVWARWFFITAAILVLWTSETNGEMTVGGLDVSYQGGRARAVAVVLDFATMKVAEQSVIEMEVSFPYIPGLFSFREVPPLLAAIEQLAVMPEVWLCDGQGLPEPLGLAHQLTNRL